MTQQEQKQLARGLACLSVFRGMLQYPAMSALTALLDAPADTRQKAQSMGEFVYALAGDGYCLSDFLCRTVYADENPLIVSAARGEEIPAFLMQNAQRELALFTRLTELRAADLFCPSDAGEYVPQFENRRVDFEKTYLQRMAQVDRFGYGIFATAKMFRAAGDSILPVQSADGIELTSFVGYEAQRKQVFDNTKALCEGKPAANVLLFGDAGTGKSSTVKACANYFADRGVRLIELRKDQLFSLSDIMGRIAANPLKFIIFIDDLSFNKNDDCFSMLKAVLEGSASAKAKNAVIYATSNRRHIVKESFSDRGASDDIHHNDTVPELMSLSDRFGLAVYFEKPNKALYLQIIHSLAQKNGIETDQKELDIQAEAFALARGNRSPRTAEQFINSLIAKQ